MRKSVVVVAIIVTVIACVMCLMWVLLPRPPHPLERARDLVAVGDSREKAIELLAADAWYHQPCTINEDSGTDLFFYGSRGYDRAQVVIINSRLQNGELQVSQIATCPRYIWQSHYFNCIDEKRFEYGLPEQIISLFPFLK